MVNEKVKYGIIGCGKHALQSHAIPGKDIPNLELTAICDISTKSLDNFEKEYADKLEKYKDSIEFFNSNINAVLIGSPDEVHFQNLRDSIHAGNHTFAEKPLATKSEELTDLNNLLNIAAKNNLIISSCHLRRFDPPFIWLKENIPSFEQAFGKPMNFSFDFSYHKPSKTWKHDRGLLLDHANHEIDLLNFLFGHSDFEAKTLHDSHDRYHIAGNRGDNINFDFQGTRRLDSRNYLEWAGVRFEKADVKIDTHKGMVRVHKHESNEVFEYDIPKTDYNLRGKMTLVNFANAIQGYEDCYLTNEDLFVNTAVSVALSEKDDYSYVR